MKIMNTPNKSLELSPGVPTTSVAAFSMNVEAVRRSAGQLNSMLGVINVGAVRNRERSIAERKQPELRHLSIIQNNKEQRSACAPTSVWMQIGESARET